MAAEVPILAQSIRSLELPHVIFVQYIYLFSAGAVILFYNNKILLKNL